MIKRLNLSEVAALYRTRIKADFPLAERRPLFMIQSLYQQGRYVCLVLEEAGQFLAYATFICDDAVDGVLLDYYAVFQEQRGKGIGSRFLTLLQAYWSNKGGIVLECERPESAKGKEEEVLRRRRIDFYLRGGAGRTSLRWRLFGVDYSILWLPVTCPAGQADVAEVLTALYMHALPPVLGRLFTRMETEPIQ